MADQDQVEFLKKSVAIWNQWIKENSDTEIDLHKANLRDANLRGANLRGAVLTSANLRGANLSSASLHRADLREAILHKANLHRADLREADLWGSALSQANLRGAILSGVDLSKVALNGADLRAANFSGANLSKLDLRGLSLSGVKLQKLNLSGVDLSGVDLSGVDLSGASLSGASLSGANLSGANLSGANLSGANLYKIQALGTNFRNANFTGTCIEDWHINKATNLEGIQCDYIYRSFDTENKGFTGRLPVDVHSIFQPSEFTGRFQILASALETIDLTFTEGIDWQAFFQSFQELQQQSDEGISIQGMERKGETFIIRLETSTDTDRGAIEARAKELYKEQLKRFESEYKKRLQLQGAHLADIQTNLDQERQRSSRLLNIVETMADKPTHDLRGARFGGGFAAEGSIQVGGSFTDYSINIQHGEEIAQLLTSLRYIAQSFPEPLQDNALVDLDDLKDDLSTPEKCKPKRISKRLKSLLAASTAAVTFAGNAATGAADLSNKANEFTDNIMELSHKLGIELPHPKKSN